MDTLTRKEALQLGIIGDNGLGFVKPQTAYRNINERILAEIKKGNLVWRKGWRNGVVVKGQTYGPQNYETQRPYSGGNAFFIGMVNLFNRTNYQFFLTKKQIADRGAKLKKDAKAFPVSVFIENDREKVVKRGGKEIIVVESERGMIWYMVYPIEHVENLEPIKRREKRDTFNEIIVADAEDIITGMPKAPPIKHGGNEAYYMPSQDYVQMPHKKAFKIQQRYYSVLFHELIHSTGHKKRLNREMGGAFGSKSYAFEELIAELGAAYLCGVCSIDYYTVDQSAAYLKGWAKRLTTEIERDPDFLKRAVFKAAKAANFIIGKTLEKEGKERTETEAKEEHFPGAEVKPNKTIKASVASAIEDIMTLKQYKNLKPMFVSMLFRDFKDGDAIIGVGEMKQTIYEKHPDYVEESITGPEWEIKPAGRELIDKIKGRLHTLKAKKGGQDLFPDLAGTAAKDGLVLFLSAMLETHGRTVTREELEAIIEELRAYAALGIIAATHPLKRIANSLQVKVVALINRLKPGESVPVQLSAKKKIESAIQSLNGLGFWPTIASAVVGKGAELLAKKHFFNKEALAGISDSVIDDLISLYEQAELHKKSNKSIIIGTISAGAAEQIRKKYDIDVKGYKHLVTFADARHIYKMHGEGRETNKRQAPVTPADFALYPYIVDNYDTVTYELNERGEKTLKYTKYISNYFVVVEEIVERYKTLKLKTLFIKKTKPPIKSGGLTGSRSAAANATPSIKRPGRTSLDRSKVQKKDELQNLGFIRADKRDLATEASPDSFTLPGPLGKLLGIIRPYKYAILLTGDPHAGKTEVVCQLIDAFASMGKKVAAYMIEQGGMESQITQEAIDRNVKKANQANLFVTGDAPKGLDTIKEHAQLFDVIVIDSWQKLGVPATRFDELRHEFPEKIFITIFQQNGQGGTRGGVSADYDTPVHLKVHKVDETFKNNYVEVKKNRGNGDTLQLRYLVAAKKTTKSE